MEAGGVLHTEQRVGMPYATLPINPSSAVKWASAAVRLKKRFDTGISSDFQTFWAFE